jgi:hypothetical protein
MKDINTVVIRSRLQQLILLCLWTCASTIGWTDDKVTRVYLLKHVEVSNIGRVINIAVRDPSHIRVIAGQGKRLVVSDTADQQDIIAQLLPVLDQPTSETDPDKIQMKMLMNASQYLRQQKIAMKSTVAPTPSPSVTSGKAPVPGNASGAAPGVQSSDKFKPAAYQSIYASDDAKLTRGPRKITDEPVALSLSGMELKGIFKTVNGSPLALLSFGGVNYTAHDGGLFERNRIRVKDVTSKVLKDKVILVGQDRIPREITFKSTL